MIYMTDVLIRSKIDLNRGDRGTMSPRVPNDGGSTKRLSERNGPEITAFHPPVTLSVSLGDGTQ